MNVPTVFVCNMGQIEHIDQTAMGDNSSWPISARRKLFDISPGHNCLERAEPLTIRTDLVRADCSAVAPRFDRFREAGSGNCCLKPLEFLLIKT
jgi:hypothetical protein